MGGTLDPKVTGCLPIALDRATRIVQVLLGAGKEYVCLMYLHKPVTENDILKKFKKFQGKIKQVPPIRSAVKRQERERTIYYIEVLEIEGQDVLFKIGCQAGTYIRKFAHDFGVELGCGAHMVQLVRTKAGPFKYDDSFTLHDLKDGYEFYKEESLLEQPSLKKNLGEERISEKGEGIRKIILPFERAVDHLGKVWIVDGAVDPVCHGSDLYVAGISKLNDKIEKDDIVAVFTLKNELVCIGKVKMNSESLLELDRGVAVTGIKVFMNRGIYSEG